MPTVREVIVDALEELRVVGATREASADDMAIGLRRLNRMIDGWNAEPMALYASGIATYTITPALQPHTIGPTAATWTVTQRPSSIRDANLIIDGLRYPIWIRQADWWMNWIVQPQFTSSIPTDLYYNPAWPNGQVYLWPVPTTAYSIELLTDSVLGMWALADTLSMPPGYQEAITLTLAEKLASAYGIGVSPDLKAGARAARAVIFEANVPTPPIQTADVGLNRPWGWNNYTGTWTP
jgi:hypothetical protein